MISLERGPAIVTRAQAILLGVVCVVVLVYGASWLSDSAHASTVRITARTTPPLLPADGQSTGTFAVRVTDSGGAPRVGDTIEVLNLTSRGAFDRTRATTDRRGQVSFTYTTSMYNVYQGAGPVGVQVTDTSLGQLIEIDKSITAYINTVDPAKLKKGT
jgi:hypothetical protein